MMPGKSEKRASNIKRRGVRVANAVCRKVASHGMDRKAERKRSNEQRLLEEYHEQTLVMFMVVARNSSCRCCCYCCPRKKEVPVRIGVHDRGGAAQRCHQRFAKVEAKGMATNIQSSK